ncbi:thiol reductant ABC exporter subunit CydD [Camelimonas sp. ID_303_24]
MGVARKAALIQTAAALVWLPQAALIAWAVGGLAHGAPASAMLAPAAGVLALGLVRAALDALGVRYAFQGARPILTARRLAACEAVAARSPLDVNRVASGEAAAIIGEQAEAVQAWLSRFQPARLKASIAPLVILACVIPFSWVAGLILLIAAPLIPLFMALIGWRAKAASEAQLVEMGAMNAFLLDRLRGLATIRTLGAVETTATRLRANAESVRRKTMAVLRIAFLSSAVLELFSALGVALVAVYIGFHLLGELPFGAWGGKLTLAQGLFILLLAPAFFDPLRELSAVWHDKAAGEAAMVALDRLSAAGGGDGAIPLPGAWRTQQPGDATVSPPQAASPPQALSLPQIDYLSQVAPLPQASCPAGPLAVTAHGLGFRYPGATGPALPDGISISIAAGERVALLGPSGGGKSTLLALLAGLAAPRRGVITIGGQPLDDANVAGLRQRMAWIGQQPHVFTGPLEGNVSLGRPAPDARANARQALRWASLADVAAGRGGAIIGEGGVGLSGGEALRLALARAAFNHDAGLVLADEPTAHLDRATASAVTESLLDLAVGRTLIVATHDPELASRMDRTIHLAATGAPEERT